ncbi:Acetyltransferase Pat [Rhodobacteraceae bacterium THAF1]|uniref:GNAT family N-acetyltransferase n=1 Tax=Palleronia sp. THAF1 TaxID=2587842 RepID=UPI000F3D4B15|nr:GNAT family N-acetyltransferase [Palleronia sp. THAF1]QFU07476.1 Acetyltransferase Pat [Palleronia sp. THAF1]VDC20410.1 Acetyltransferase Pat [Rhodobacteraceae bacterium THAF1]
MSDDAPIVTRLRDGTRVLLRAPRPSDAAALRQGFDDLSQHSRMMRFLSTSSYMSDPDATRFVSPDNFRHGAVGALVLDDESPKQVPAGIAHFFRATDTGTRAELALTVVDAFQGRGLGMLLLGRLLHDAAAIRIEALDAIVHPRNRAMAGLMVSLGADPVDNSGERAFVLPVHADPSDYPDNRSGDAVRAAWQLTPGLAAA